MSWKAFWILAAVYILMVVSGWLTNDVSLALIVVFLAGYQLYSTYTGRPW